ncbi:unnamed protein product [Prunus armeniaca]
MASSSFRPKCFDLNVVPKTTRDAKVWRPSFVSQNRHLTVNDSMMMNDMIAIISADSVSNIAHRLRARANEIQELNTENSSLRRMLHDSQQEVETLKRKIRLC